MAPRAVAEDVADWYLSVLDHTQSNGENCSQYLRQALLVLTRRMYVPVASQCVLFRCSNMTVHGIAFGGDLMCLDLFPICSWSEDYNLFITRYPTILILTHAHI